MLENVVVKVHYHHQLDWSVDLSSSFNHPCEYMLLKTKEEMGESCSKMLLNSFYLQAIRLLNN
jgi:hypothetical protein